MCQALMELMQSHIEVIVKERAEAELKKGLEQGLEQGRVQGLEQGRKEGIRGAIGTLWDFGHEDSEIMAAIIKKFNISEKQTRNFSNFLCKVIYLTAEIFIREK